nr:glutamate receptor ionotropic, NMDA 3A-like [Oncorhynchus nerka]
MGNNQQQLQPCVPWNSSNCNRRKIPPPQESLLNVLESPPCDFSPPPPPPSALPPPSSPPSPQVKSLVPRPSTSNGRTDQVGLQARTNPMLQELSELETHITIIKQQLHIAMMKKRELEQPGETHDRVETGTSRNTT